MLASNITWNAYNSFGGRSNYINPDRLPPRPTVNARLELKRYTDPDNVTYDTDDYAPLSFDRPEPINHIDASTEISDPIEGRAACHIAPAEWRLLGWLEREQFAYDYYAETQLHDGTLDLDAYKVLILSTHPEYWSRKMYHRVKSWVNERGGRLMYLGGNGLNCEAELTDDAAIYRNGDARVLKSGGFESRFHMRVESEAALLGVVFTETGIMTGAPYRVRDAAHWAFAGTGLRDGDLFGQASLHRRCPGGASGHETDKVSPSSPPGVVCLAKGTNVDDGGAELAYYETPSGGAVFSAGSIAWPSAILVDDCVSQITANVLRRLLRRSAIVDPTANGSFDVHYCSNGRAISKGRRKSSLRITRLEAIPVRVPLKPGMVTKTAHGDHHTSDYVIVKVHTDAGPGRAGRGDGLGALERRDEQELRGRARRPDRPGAGRGRSDRDHRDSQNRWIS